MKEGLEENMFNTCVVNDKCESNLSKKELLGKVQSLAFTINELALYLDTHPKDDKALALHKQYAKQYRNAYEEYQRKYGPLSIFCPCNSWRWIASPWPWEGGMK